MTYTATVCSGISSFEISFFTSTFIIDFHFSHHIGIFNFFFTGLVGSTSSRLTHDVVLEFGYDWVSCKAA